MALPIGSALRPIRPTGLLVLLWLALLGVDAVPASGDDGPPVFRNGGDQFTLLRPQRPAPMTMMMAQDGALLNLGRFRGKVVLLNLWATWCAPCVRELPALDRLQGRLGGDDFQVVALSIDETGMEVPLGFARRLGLGHLKIHLDLTGSAAEAFPLYGLPISYLIDREGAVVGYIVGAARWDSPEAVNFLTYYIKQTRGRSGVPDPGH